MASVNSFSGTHVPVRSSYTKHVSVTAQEADSSSKTHKNEGKLHERKFPETRLVARQAAEKTADVAPRGLNKAVNALTSQTGKAIATGFGVGIAAIVLAPLDKHNLVKKKNIEEGVKHTNDLLFAPAKETMKLKFDVIKEIVMSPVKWGVGAIGAAATGLLNKSTTPVVIHMPHRQNNWWNKLPFV